jgi:hypothetical protein
MAELGTFSEGGYRYIPGVFPYSAGVTAEPGYRLERARFAVPVPVDEGFRRIRAHLASVGRPVTAFCACELRSPAPFTEAGFSTFNRLYGSVLQECGILRNGVNPVARSNVCPQAGVPAVPVFHAFTYTVPGEGGGFVVAGSGEAPEGKPTYRDHIVRLGDLSQDGLREKAGWVLGEQERRLKALGVGWPETTAVQVFTVHDVFPFVVEELVRRGGKRPGIVRELCRPPVVDIEFEMDCRGVPRELRTD